MRAPLDIVTPGWRKTLRRPATPHLTAKGCCVAILCGLVLAIIATIVKAATGHSIAGLLVLLMILMGVFSLVWDWATGERGR